MTHGGRSLAKNRVINGLRQTLGRDAMHPYGFAEAWNL